jgi:hypothetical protein
MHGSACTITRIELRCSQLSSPLSPSISSLMSPSINILEAKKKEKYGILLVYRSAGCTCRTRIYAPKSFNYPCTCRRCDICSREEHMSYVVLLYNGNTAPCSPVWASCSWGLFAGGSLSEGGFQVTGRGHGCQCFWASHIS